jgi:hypothetical protein
MTDKEKTIRELKEVLDGLDITNKYRLNIIRAIEYLQEEPVSKDLEKAAKHYLYSNILYDDVYVGNPTDKDCIEMFKVGANWQKQQMLAKAVDVTIAIPYPNGYGGYTQLVDSKEALPFGDNIKVLVINNKHK